ncbi:MAG TPA: glycosyltransferase family 2 protein [Candidimonas sp.]|nr:glycosyltransferase family 2 protein [Candidimonas sp.]
MMTYKVCAVIPVYNHGSTVGAVVARMRTFGLACVLVDDGSSAACAAVLDQLAARGDAMLLRRTFNGGKGAAVKDGLRAAHAAGYTHALQIDADGQHALGDVPAFLAASRARPDALVCGAPTYGADMPRARYYGRWLTHVWVWINTLSFDIRDAMCGFRLYPLAGVLPVIDEHAVGERMDFDIGVLVPMHWRGTPMHWISTPVVYPEDGLSHFNVWRDNILISRMHTRLFFGMLRRAPCLLYRRLAHKGRS